MINKKGLTRFALVLMVMALLVGSIFMSACCTEVVTAKEGDTVRVLYTGTFDDGEVFDSSELHGGEALNMTIGEGKVLPSFEQAVIGLSLNESTTVHIPVDEAYGPLEVVFDLDRFSPDNPPEVGQQGQVQLENGKVIAAIVTDISDSRVTFANTHPLAGENLTFEIQLVEIL